MMKIGKKLAAILLTVAMVVTLIPVLGTQTAYAEVPDQLQISFELGESFHGINRDSDSHAFVAAGSICWFSQEEISKQHEKLPEAFHDDNFPAVYIWNVKEFGSFNCELDERNGKYYWHVPAEAAGEIFHMVLVFDNKVYFESEPFTVCEQKAFLDTAAKTISIHMKDPLPGLKYADASLTPGTAKVNPEGYDTLCSVVNLPVGEGNDYIMLFQRWSKYMMPEKYMISEFEDNNQYHYEVIADFSQAGEIKDDFTSYMIDTPGILWDSFLDIRKSGNFMNSLYAGYTNGVDKYASIDMGQMAFNLIEGPITLHSAVEKEYNMGQAAAFTLYWSGINSRYDESTDISYFDLDGDGKEDIYGTYDSSNNSILGVCDTCNLTGMYTVKLPAETIKELKSSQGHLFYESVTFFFSKLTNPLKIKPKTATVKYSKLKKKDQTLAVKKVINFTQKGQGKITYTLQTAKKGKKSFKKYFKINKTNGKVTVKKGLKKGTYKVKVKVQAAGNANYKALTKSVTFTIKVK